MNTMISGPIKTPVLEKLGMTPEQIKQIDTQWVLDVPLARH